MRSSPGCETASSSRRSALFARPHFVSMAWRHTSSRRRSRGARSSTRSPALGPYPVVLDLGGRPVLVVGGGAVAERKVEGLRAAGASIMVVSPRVSARLAKMADDGDIRVRLRSYRRRDLRGVAIVFAATDDRNVNAAVAADSRRRRIWVNAADDPEDRKSTRLNSSHRC